MTGTETASGRVGEEHAPPFSSDVSRTKGVLVTVGLWSGVRFETSLGGGVPQMMGVSTMVTCLGGKIRLERGVVKSSPFSRLTTSSRIGGSTTVTLSEGPSTSSGVSSTLMTCSRLSSELLPSSLELRIVFC